jgi:Cdc6-like AAA superfamily ATPase
MRWLGRIYPLCSSIVQAQTEGVTEQAKQVLEHALTLAETDRRQVGEALLDSVPPEAEEEIEAAWIEEAKRRADEIERGEAVTRDGKLVVAEILASFTASGGTSFEINLQLQEIAQCTRLPENTVHNLANFEEVDIDI